MNKPRIFVFLSFGKILAQFRKNLLSFEKIFSVLAKFPQFFKENSCIFFENVSKPSNFDGKLIKMPKNGWIWSKKTQNWFKISKIDHFLKSGRNLTCLEISYFSVSAILLSFGQNWRSVSAKILSKKSLLKE